MSMRLRRIVIALLSVVPLSQPLSAQQSQEERSLDELRNTVVNLLQTLVQRGVLTREQAEAMVKSAQEKTAAEAAASVQQEKADAGAVRVPYVPEVVKEQISQQVAAQVTPEVAKEVIAQAKTEKWGVPGALPDWLSRISWSGDIRVRGEGDVFASGNLPNSYLNYNAVNAAGGIARAGVGAFLNTTIDRYYLLARLRLNMDAQLGQGWSVGARLTTGTLTNPDSTNQVLGRYGARYQTDLDEAFLRWTGSFSHRQDLTVSAGKFNNPFVSTDLVWDTDVTFEGVAGNYKVPFGHDANRPHYVFATLGAFPVQEIDIASSDKWLYAGQVGIGFGNPGATGVRLGVAYYDYTNLVGRRNPLDDPNLYDYTAPSYVQKGNTMFNIRNSTDPTAALYALASNYRQLDALVMGDWLFTNGHRLGYYFDYVKNLGYDSAAVAARVGSSVPAKVTGYQTEVSYGSNVLDHGGAWRAFIGYRYLERDAVLDAFTDQDFHLGGTDAKGYFIGGDYSLTERVWARVRYMSFDTVEGAPTPPFGVDVWQAELNARF
jgi:hypothetical protein